MELLVIGTILLLAALVGFFALQNFIDRARIKGIVDSTATQMKLARLEAIKNGVPVVVRPDFDADDILLYVNVDQDVALQFDPDDTAPFRTVDYELVRLRLPTEYRISFWGAEDNSPEGRNAVVGFTSIGAGPNVSVFQPDGSVRDPGALRFGDDRGNFFEVRVEPKATALIEVRKFHPDPPWGGRPGYFPAGRHEGTGDPLWEWY